MSTRPSMLWSTKRACLPPAQEDPVYIFVVHQKMQTGTPSQTVPQVFCPRCSDEGVLAAYARRGAKDLGWMQRV